MKGREGSGGAATVEAESEQKGGKQPSPISLQAPPDLEPWAVGTDEAESIGIRLKRGESEAKGFGEEEVLIIYYFKIKK